MTYPPRWVTRAIESVPDDGDGHAVRLTYRRGRTTLYIDGQRITKRTAQAMPLRGEPLKHEPQ